MMHKDPTQTNHSQSIFGNSQPQNGSALDNSTQNAMNSDEISKIIYDIQNGAGNQEQKYISTVTVLKSMNVNLNNIVEILKKSGYREDYIFEKFYGIPGIKDILNEDEEKFINDKIIDFVIQEEKHFFRKKEDNIVAALVELEKRKLPISSIIKRLLINYKSKEEKNFILGNFLKVFKKRDTKSIMEMYDAFGFKTNFIISAMLDFEYVEETYNREENYCIFDKILKLLKNSKLPEIEFKSIAGPLLEWANKNVKGESAPKFVIELLLKNGFTKQDILEEYAPFYIECYKFSGVLAEPKASICLPGKVNFRSTEKFKKTVKDAFASSYNGKYIILNSEMVPFLKFDPAIVDEVIEEINQEQKSPQDPTDTSFPAVMPGMFPQVSTGMQPIPEVPMPGMFPQVSYPQVSIDTQFPVVVPGMSPQVSYPQGFTDTQFPIKPSSGVPDFLDSENPYKNIKDPLIVSDPMSLDIPSNEEHEAVSKLASDTVNSIISDIISGMNATNEPKKPNLSIATNLDSVDIAPQNLSVNKNEVLDIPPKAEDVDEKKVKVAEKLILKLIRSGIKNGVINLLMLNGYKKEEISQAIENVSDFLKDSLIDTLKSELNN